MLVCLVNCWSCGLRILTIFTYESWPIPKPGKQATSPANPGRRIGRADGLDRAFPGHFAKKVLELKRNQSAVQVPLSKKFAKKLSIFLKINLQSNSTSWRKFANKTLSSHKINPTSLSSLSFFFKKTLRF